MNVQDKGMICFDIVVIEDDRRFTVEIALIRGELFRNCDRIFSKILSYGQSRGFELLNPMYMGHIRDKFFDGSFSRMGIFEITGIHTPIQKGEKEFLLSVRRGQQTIHRKLCIDRWQECILPRSDGLAFVVSKVDCGCL